MAKKKGCSTAQRDYEDALGKLDKCIRKKGASKCKKEANAVEKAEKRLKECDEPPGGGGGGGGPWVSPVVKSPGKKKKPSSKKKNGVQGSPVFSSPMKEAVPASPPGPMGPGAVFGDLSSYG